MIEINVITDSTANKRLAYVLKFVNAHPLNTMCRFYLNGPETKSQNIYYQSIKSNNDHFYIRPQNVIFSEKHPISLVSLAANCYDYNGQNLYSVEDRAKTKERFMSDGIFSFDIFEMMFFHISRIEETVLKMADFIDDKLEFEKKMFSIRNGIEKTAVVDDLVAVLIEIFTHERVERKPYKVVSHDIDHIRLFSSRLDIIKKTAGIVYHQKGYRSMQVLWKNYIHYLRCMKDPYDSYDWMLRSPVDSKRIYFLVGGSHRWDSLYNLEDPLFKSAVKLARDNGYTIGVHPSYSSWNSRELIQREKNKLEYTINAEVKISRQHFLNFDIEQTPAALLSAGIGSDSSMAYTRHTGYRCGTAYPYLLYDFENERATTLIEEPLVFMDMAWYYEAERTGNWDLDFERFNGCFNFHNSFFFQAEQLGIPFKEVYLTTFGI